MSTGGLEAPSTDDDAMWFTGFYSLIGVPLYGAALAVLANYIGSRQADAQVRQPQPQPQPQPRDTSPGRIDETGLQSEHCKARA